MAGGVRKVGYARCAADGSDAAALRAHLTQLGAGARVHLDYGLQATHTGLPGLQAALTDLAPGGQLVVPGAHKLARSIRHLHDITVQLHQLGATLNINGQVHNPGRLAAFLEVVVELQAELGRERAREGAERGRREGRQLGAARKLTDAQETHLAQLRQQGHTIPELIALFGVGRGTVYRALNRQQGGGS